VVVSKVHGVPHPVTRIALTFLPSEFILEDLV
jgi:hypothetical protein